MVTRAALVNEVGEKTSKVFTISPTLSAARPVLFSDRTIRWYTIDRYTAQLHILNPASMKEGFAQPVEIYRLYNRNAEDHHYTLSEKEKDFLISEGWEYDGIGWYELTQ